MADYSSYYLQTEGGRSPVEEFIDSLHSATQRKFFYKRKLLGEFGPKLPYPHAKYVGEHLYELRFEGHEGHVRVFYFFDGRRIIFMHAMKKKTQKIPPQELVVAIQRKNAYMLDARNKKEG